MPGLSFFRAPESMHIVVAGLMKDTVRGWIRQSAVQCYATAALSTGALHSPRKPQIIDHSRPAVNNRLAVRQLVKNRQASGKQFFEVTAVTANCSQNCQAHRIWKYPRKYQWIYPWIYPTRRFNNKKSRCIMTSHDAS